jgi:hypothetical protein
MKKENKSLAPQNIDEHNWYYEEKKGIVIVHEVMEKARYIRTDQFVIPWAKLRKSVKRNSPQPIKR